MGLQCRQHSSQIVLPADEAGQGGPQIVTSLRGSRGSRGSRDSWGGQQPRQTRDFAPEQLEVQGPELRARIGAETVGQEPAARLESRECLGRTAGCRQRTDQRCGERLVDRVALGQRLELADRLGGPAAAHVDVESLQTCAEPELGELQPPARRVGPLARIGQRLTAPQSLGGDEIGQCARVVAVRQLATALLHQRGEQHGIDGLGRDRQPVTDTILLDQHRAPQRPTQPGHE